MALLTFPTTAWVNEANLVTKASGAISKSSLTLWQRIKAGFYRIALIPMFLGQPKENIDALAVMLARSNMKEVMTVYGETATDILAPVLNVIKWVVYIVIGIFLLWLFFGRKS